MARGRKVPITPTVLQWAIASSGYTNEDVAAQLRLHPSHVQHWLRGDDRPAITEFRNLARLLRRPTATFLLPAPPVEPLASVQFRPAPGDAPRSLFPEEQLRIREAERLQRAVAWLSKETGEIPPEIPLVSGKTDPERAAGIAREFLAVPLSDQEAWSSDSVAQRGWREALERSGVLVLLLPMGANAARGFSIWHDDAPLIAVNTHWSAAARSFTMLHELGHLVTRTSSICAEFGRRRRRPPGADIERWYEQFAGAALMPTDAVETTLTKLGIPQRQSVNTIRDAGRIARAFHVSLRATILRLIALERSDWDLYASLPQASDAKRGGGGGGGRSRIQIRLDEYGQRPAQTFLAGMKKGVINASEVVRYLDVPYSALGQLETLAS